MLLAVTTPTTIAFRLAMLASPFHSDTRKRRESERMVAEKPPAFADASMKAGRAALRQSGALMKASTDPMALGLAMQRMWLDSSLAFVRPLSKKTSSNARRLGLARGR
ncbi:MAG: hypothetical protein ACFB3T_09325 [Geminicoccaceae bacterium]